MKRVISFVTSVVMLLGMVLYLPNINVLSADGRAYNQKDAVWKNYTYGTGNLYDTGCGIFSFANAIYALNGIYVNILDIAEWAHTIRAFNPGNTDSGTYRYILYDNIEGKYGGIYGFRLKGYYNGGVSDGRLQNHLLSGGVAVAHVQNHFIAITGYNSGNNTFHVIESFEYSGRGFSPDGWVAMSRLSTGNWSKVDWFVLIESTQVIPPSKPVLSISSGTTTQLTTFSWDACSNTNRYDLRIFPAGSADLIIYQETTGTSATIQLPEGSWYASVAATNTDSTLYTFSDNVNFDVALGICEPKAVTTYNGHVYALYENKTYYSQAQQLAWNMGGHLATITSQEENEAVTSLMQNASGGEYWLGATDVAQEGVWLWETNEPFSYTHWASGEPNNDSGVENYLTIYPSGWWNDARSMTYCYNGFILEIEELPIAKKEEYNGHIYYRIDHASNWIEAEEYCKLLGGHLVTINDKEENEFIKSFVSDGSKDRYWIGVYNPAKTHTPKWVSGEALEYDNWAEGEPSYSGDVEFWGEFYKNSGTWNDVSNYNGGVDGFICELEKTVKTIEISQDADKKGYYLDESIDLTGLELFVEYDEGESEYVTSGFTATADTSRLGDQIVTVSYKGKEVEYTINVKCPKPEIHFESKTDSSVNLTWRGISIASEYSVSVNGTVMGRTTDNFYTITGLKPETEYRIQVTAFDENGKSLTTSDDAYITTAKCVSFSGAGTEENPYRISNASDLMCLSDMINDALTNPHFRNAYYQQVNDINMQGRVLAPIGSCADSPNAVFAGVYDGGYHEITNLTVANADYTGLFGKVGAPDVNARIENLVVSGNVSGSGQYAGGIAAELSYGAVVNECAFYGDVSATEAAGGIVGIIEKGGIADACYHNGTVQAAISGGVVGSATQETEAGYDVFVVSCYHHGGSVGGTHTGGIFGNLTYQDSSLSTIGVYNNYFEKSAAVGGINGSSTEGAKAVNEIVLSVLGEMLGNPYADHEDADLNNGCPVFIWQLPLYKFAGDGTAANPYRIRSKEELLTLADYLNNPTLNPMFSGNYYMQTKDIDLSGEAWIPMASNQGTGFSGVYDGSYHTIRNLSSNDETFGGFFGRIDGGKVQNLVIENGSLISKYGSAGGIASQIGNEAVIQECAYIGTIDAYCSGGLVGMTTGDSSVISSYQNGMVTGEEYAGGLIGMVMDGNVKMKNCYHGDGIVSAKSNGGIIGTTNTDTSVSNCFYYKETATGAVNGSTYAGGASVNLVVLSVLAETLGSPFADNTNDNYMNGAPVFAWQSVSAADAQVGDINYDGQISLVDVVILQRYLLGSYQLTQKQALTADMNGDKAIDVFDLVYLKRALLKKNGGKI